MAAHLQIRFAQGERPYWFWVSDWMPRAVGAARYKVLSKRRSDGAIEVLLIEERVPGERRALLRRDLEPGTPSGWLERWVDELSESLGAKFQAFDLRGITSEDAWRDMADQLGWLAAVDARSHGA